MTHRVTRRSAAFAAVLAVAAATMALEPGAASAGTSGTSGWRGNWTGSFPDATPPLEWGRKARSFVNEITFQAARPAADAGRGGEPVVAGMVRDWLVMGPIAVDDILHRFDKPAVPGEAELRPAEGDAGGGLSWKRFQIAKQPDWQAWGTAELEYVDLAQPLGSQPGCLGYAHTYLYCARPGRVAFVIDHSNAAAAWVNGQPLYSSASQAMGLWVYPALSRQKQELIYNRSPRFEADLRQGWNSLLVKVGTYPSKDSPNFKFALRLHDVEPVTYEDKNIAWVADLGERTNATPIVVGDRLFTVAEPDELVCLDKHTGKVLWRAFHNLYEATPADQRAADPAFAEKVEPLAKRLAEPHDYETGLEIRRKMDEALIAIDRERYKLRWDGHLASHFAIVGFTTTPVSDGKHVWAFFGQGVVACYDLEGRRQWITRLEAEEVLYSCSPALIDGKLVCVFGGTWCLDAATGKTLWHDEEATSIASLIPATVRGVDVVVNKSGTVFRVSDGKQLWTNPHIVQGDSGWSPPVVLGDVMYLPMFGICNLIVVDFSEVEGDEWKPEVRTIELDAEHKKPNGQWWDRNTAASPLVVNGRHYIIDQFGVFYAVDLATGKTLYGHDTGFDELHHYNAIGVGASATLGGDHIFVIDNQGACVVLEPGDTYKPVAVNHIQTLLPRDWPIGAQELLANAAPLFDGDRIYFRGERYLYCIAKPGERQVNGGPSLTPFVRSRSVCAMRCQTPSPRYSGERAGERGLRRMLDDEAGVSGRGSPYRGCRKLNHFPFLLLLVTVVGPAVPALADSPGWRGDGSGRYGAVEVPPEWDGASGQNVAWKAEVGEGQSSPVVAGGRVFVTSEPDKLVALDSRGTVLWTRTSNLEGLEDVAPEQAAKPARTTQECGYAAPTPVSDGEHVWVCYGTGVVACYDVAGNRRWAHFVDQPVVNPYGRSASPLLVDGKLIVSVGMVTAIDPVDGKELWRSTAKASYGTPAEAKIGDTPVLIMPAGDVVRLSDGRVLAAKVAVAKYSSPVVDGDVVYFAGARLVALKLPDKLDEPLKLARLWQNSDAEGDIFTSPLIHDGLLYCGNAAGELYVIDARTGETVYAKELDIASAGGLATASLYPSPTLAGTTILLSDNAGRCLAIAPGREFRKLGRGTLPAGSGASPVGLGKHLLLRGGNMLYCVDGGDRPHAVDPIGVDMGKYANDGAEEK